MKEINNPAIVSEIKSLIEQSKQQVAVKLSWSPILREDVLN